MPANNVQDQGTRTSVPATPETEVERSPASDCSFSAILRFVKPLLRIVGIGAVQVLAVLATAVLIQIVIHRDVWAVLRATKEVLLSW